MRPGGVEIQPDEPELPADVSATGLLRAVRGRGRDAAGLVEFEVDAAGDLVDVVVSDLASRVSGTALADAIREAFGAARAELATALERHAAQAAETTRVERDASVARLEDVAARAEQQLTDILGRLGRLADRTGDTPGGSRA